MSDDAVHCTDCAIFLSTKVLFSKKYKKVSIIFHKNQRLHIVNQYRKDITQVAPEIIEKFEEQRNIIPQQIDETLNEQQMKYPKMVEALDRIFT